MASANIVGYTTLEVTKEYSILAINFKNVDGTDSMPINSVLPYTEGMTKGNATSSADQIQVMREDGGYNIYFMCNGSAGKATVTDGDGKWVKDGQSTVTEDTIANGSAFWYVSKTYNANASATPYNITVAGSVEMASTSSRDIAQSYMLLANPYPCEVPLNDGVKVTSGATKGNATSSADQIQIMREDGGYNIYFLSNGSAGKATVTNGDGKWVKDGESAVTPDTFPANRGGWFISKGGNATVEFTSPITK